MGYEIALGFIGVVIGWFANQYRNLLVEDADFISLHILEIDELVAVLQDYWLTTPASREIDFVLAAKARSRHAATNSFYGVAPEYLTPRRLRSFHVLYQRLFAVGLGGNFESASRRAEPETAIEVFELGNQLKFDLRMARRDVLSLKKLVSKISRIIAR